MGRRDNVWSDHADSEEIVSKATLFDRLNQELEAFGRRAQAAIDEGKLQIEVLRLKRQRDHAARDLGMLVYRREKGGEVEVRRIDALMLRLDDLGPEIERMERQIAEAKGRGPTAQTAESQPSSGA
jgi:hypothetical protein